MDIVNHTPPLLVDCNIVCVKLPRELQVVQNSVVRLVLGDKQKAVVTLGCHKGKIYRCHTCGPYGQHCCACCHQLCPPFGAVLQASEGVCCIAKCSQSLLRLQEHPSAFFVGKAEVLFNGTFEVFGGFRGTWKCPTRLSTAG